MSVRAFFKSVKEGFRGITRHPLVTAASITTIFLIVQISDIIKPCIALPMLKSGFWAKNIIANIQET